MYGKINLLWSTKYVNATKSLIADFVADKLELIARYWMKHVWETRRKCQNTASSIKHNQMKSYDTHTLTP